MLTKPPAVYLRLPTAASLVPPLLPITAHRFHSTFPSSAGKGSLDNINLFSIITIVSFFFLAPVALLTEVGGRMPSVHAIGN